MTRVRTRFAPSPTGTLHAGNVRTAVLNWLIARHHDGEFVLRIEDTDVERNVPGAEARLMADLRWLGLEWDEGPIPDGSGEERGDHGPYRQSERLQLYRAEADRLLAEGSAYRCFCSPAALDADRRQALREGRSPRYGGTCRRLEPDQAARRAAAGEAHVLRLATPEAGEVVVTDEIRGRVVFDVAQIGDFVILRSDGVPTYNFAVVVDDTAMRITHVIRGVGHLSNTPHQLLVYRALGASPPAFAHVPTVLAPDRTKLSKRAGATPVSEWRSEGIHPDAVVNYVSLLGWSSPSGDEILGRERLVAEVTLDRMNAADVVFDPEKMRWLSGKHIAEMSTSALEGAVRPWIEGTRFEPLLAGGLGTALEAVRGHLTAFGEVTRHLGPFLGPEAEPGPFDDDSVQVLSEARAELSRVTRWEADALSEALRSAGRSAGVRGPALYVPVRRALTGEEHGPPLAAVLEVQGREAALARLETAAGAGPV